MHVALDHQASNSRSTCIKFSSTTAKFSFEKIEPGQLVTIFFIRGRSSCWKPWSRAVSEPVLSAARASNSGCVFLREAAKQDQGQTHHRIQMEAEMGKEESANLPLFISFSFLSQLVLDSLHLLTEMPRREERKKKQTDGQAAAFLFS